MPLSSIINSYLPTLVDSLGSSLIKKVTSPPSFVYLTEFDITLVKTWTSFNLSVSISLCIMFFLYILNVIFFLLARGLITISIFFKTSSILIFEILIVCLPASILDKSNISFIMSIRILLEELILEAYSFALVSSSHSSKRLENPKIAFIGVLKSWDIFAKKDVLA